MYTRLMWVIFRILLLVTLYIVASYGAWLLAIPPHFASVFWPAAGIALAFVYLYGLRVLPGVFLGAFATVFLSPIDHLFDASGFILAAGIASGASLQACVGAYLIRTIVEQDTDFRSLRSIVLFCGIGVMSCFIASSSALAVFLLTGRIELSGALGLWEPWFIGDVLGALLMAPLAIIALKRSGISMYRRLAVILPIGLLFAVVVSLFFVLQARDSETRMSSFEGNVSLVKREVMDRFDSYYLSMRALQGFYNASSNVELHEFKTFVDYTMDTNDSIHVVAWNPYVAHGQKVDFLEDASEFYDDFQIRSISDLDNLDAHVSDVYMPVYYAVPPDVSDDIVGIDLWPDGTRRFALETARDENMIIATQPISFADVSDKANLGFLLAAPIYGANIYNPVSGPNVKPSFRGAVIGGFHYFDAVDSVMSAWHERGIELVLKAESNDKMRVVYSSEGNVDEASFIDGFVDGYPYRFAGQDWFFSYYMNSNFYNQNLNFSIWFMLIGGLGFLSFTSIFLIVLTGQSASMADLVDDKTKELSHKNKFLNVIMDAVPDMIFVKDEAFNIVQANQAFLNRFSPDERDSIVGTKGLEQFPQEEQDIYLLNDKKAFADGVSEVEEANTDYRGEVRTLQTRKQRFYDENNHAFVLGYSRDVTDLLNVQSKLETILDTTADGLMTIQEDGVIETYNKACETIFGYEASFAIGQNVGMLIPGYHPEDTLTYHQEQAGLHELEARRHDGSVFPIDISIAEVKLGARKIFSGVVRDISEKKKAEELGRQITQIFNNSIIEFYIFDAETLVFKFVNEGAIKNMGYSEDELLGQRPDAIIPEYADDRLSELVKPLLSKDQQSVEYDATHTRKDGSKYDVVANLQVTVFDGRPAFIASMLDITDRNKATQELKRSNKELESFAYVTSHDLKAPLRHVSLSAGFFKQQYGDNLDDKSSELLDIMIEGTNRMQNMIESLLTYSRVGRDVEQFTDINLNDVLLSARQNLSEVLSDSNGEIKSQVLPEIKADRYLMIQLFQNIIQNSLKYKKENIAPKITIVCDEKDGMYFISFVDNGIGIDPEYEEKIFQIFQRLHRDHEYEGVGIGLAICQRIVEFHGGSISLDTAYVDGTKIDCVLPKIKH